MSKFLNADKLNRAKDVVLDRKGTPFTEESVEKRSLANALRENPELKPKSDELVEAVYINLGGAISGAAKTEKKVAKAVSEDGSELLEDKSEGSELEEVQADGKLGKARGKK